jgi:hypothetical protein
MALQKYLKLFPEGEEAVVMKRKERITTIPAKGLFEYIIFQLNTCSNSR